MHCKAMQSPYSDILVTNEYDWGHASQRIGTGYEET